MTKLISGFTFIKNGISLGYPIKESIESIEPICDEIIINIGFDDPNCKTDDGTQAYLQDHFKHSKFKFIKSHWSPQQMKQGLILSEQTNIALAHCTGKFCQYIQGDEALHEDDLPSIQNEVIKMLTAKDIEGLIFQYRHFYGNTDIIKHTRNIYRREVRLIKNHLGIKSWLDAQGFKNKDRKKLKCIETNARVFHYGWARAEQVMANKVKAMDKLYHGNHFGDDNQFRYEKIWGLKKFTETHPRVMQKWVNDHHNPIDIMNLPKRHEWKNIGLACSDLIESITGHRIGEYKNFKIIK